MSVLVKDMDLPEDCFSCPLKEEGFCNITNAYAAQIYKRNSDCPLVELPEHHGQLIDRDALSLRGKLKLIEEREIQIYGGVSWSFAWCIAAIEDAPTVIEAEGADK